MGSILSRIERKARKEHICDICNTRIVPGERYIHIAFECDGKAYADKRHIHCDMLAERYCMAMDADEYNYTDIEYWAQDEVCKECEKREDQCDFTAMTCPIVIEALLPPTLLTHEDVRRHIKGD